MEYKKTPLTEEQEEALSEIWMRIENRAEVPQVGDSVSLTKMRHREGLGELTREDYLKVEGDEVKLTEAGYAEARRFIRNQRLSERLLSDVLNLEMEEAERTACRYEHMLDTDAAESICILLGHPRTCPHGKLIPAGECCVSGETSLRPLVVPLSELEAGETGTVAYIGTTDNARLAFLSSLGVMTGRPIELIQKKPSYILKVDENTVAFDDSVSREIFVRPSQRKRPPVKMKSRFRWGQGR
ncbi:MAG: metal-dependent transcriptional regulator [Deltaproteobacteria bacterium]|nr:metal-dependent transcriptional regulator [Deltaproteobacteria bacterium]